jgi:Tol biopolymer transport system component
MPFGMVKQGDVKMLDTTDPEYDPWISADGKTLYYAPSPVGLPQSIAVATRTSTTVQFTSSSRVDELYSGSGDGDPTLSPDQLIILFSSQRPPPNAAVTPLGVNLWYAVRPQPDVAFGAPAPVPGVNSDGNDGDPHLSADGCRLYFSSDRAGTYDLYVATVQP